MTSISDEDGLLPRDISPGASLYIRPVGLVSGSLAVDLVQSRLALPLAGGPIAFTACELRTRGGGEVRRVVAANAAIDLWARTLPSRLQERVALLLSRLSAPRVWPDRKTISRPRLMGIVNVTPDSFSDGGAFVNPEAAIRHARSLAAAGADILDVGGESTRPGAAPVDAEVEAERVVPVLRGLATDALAEDGVLLSIDTRRASVMERALGAGADIINDVSALTDDPRSLKVAAESRATIVLMHKQGDPSTMNERPAYDDVALDVFDYLEARVAACVAAGIARERLIVDPGIAFGKGSRENLKILRSLALFHGFGCPILIGASRKGLTGELERSRRPEERLPASIAAALVALDQGAQLLRVHDVAETRQAISVWRRVAGEGP